MLASTIHLEKTLKSFVESRASNEQLPNLFRSNFEFVGVRFGRCDAVNVPANIQCHKRLGDEDVEPEERFHW